MPRKAHKKPKTAAEISAELLANRMRNFAAVGLSPSQAVLANNDDVQVNRENQEHIETAKRLDAFEALKDSMKGKAFAGCYDAARRLERDQIIRRGEHDRGRHLDRVDNGRESSERSRLDQIIMAGEDVDAVLARIGVLDRELLKLLTNPPRGRFDHWRQVVAFVTGERNGNAQGAVVRYACVNLRDAYGEVDKSKAAEKRPAA